MSTATRQPITSEEAVQLYEILQPEPGQSIVNALECRRTEWRWSAESPAAANYKLERDALLKACEGIEDAYLNGSDSEWGQALIQMREAVANAKEAQ